MKIFEKEKNMTIKQNLIRNELLPHKMIKLTRTINSSWWRTYTHCAYTSFLLHNEIQGSIYRETVDPPPVI